MEEGRKKREREEEDDFGVFWGAVSQPPFSFN